MEEAIEAGITTLVFVTGGTKRAIEDHFDANSELEAALAKAGKDQMLEMVRTILPTGLVVCLCASRKRWGLGTRCCAQSRQLAMNLLWFCCPMI